jgi:hypothetical protein
MNDDLTQKALVIHKKFGGKISIKLNAGYKIVLE